MVTGGLGLPSDIVPLAAHTVSVFFSDGSTRNFEAHVFGVAPILAGTTGMVGFYALSPGVGTLAPVGDEVFLLTGTTELLQFDSLAVFDPAAFIYEIDSPVFGVPTLSYTLSAFTAMPIPEPGTYALLLAGLGLLVLARKAQARTLAKLA